MRSTSTIRATLRSVVRPRLSSEAQSRATAAFFDDFTVTLPRSSRPPVTRRWVGPVGPVGPRLISSLSSAAESRPSSSRVRFWPPCSMRATALWLVPSRSASCCWVRPRCRRASRTREPMRCVALDSCAGGVALDRTPGVWRWTRARRCGAGLVRRGVTLDSSAGGGRGAPRRSSPRRSGSRRASRASRTSPRGRPWPRSCRVRGLPESRGTPDCRHGRTRHRWDRAAGAATPRPAAGGRPHGPADVAPGHRPGRRARRPGDRPGPGARGWPVPR